MDNSLKQRIVGAVVLIALAVIFLPTLLKEKRSRGQFESAIPPQPAELANYVVDPGSSAESAQASQITPSTTKPKQVKPRQTKPKPPVTDGPKRKSRPAANKAKTETKTKDKIAKVAQKTPATISADFKEAAWVLQIASFSSKDNANRLITQLKQASFKAYRRKGRDAAGKAVYRVLVGPYIEKPKAKNALPAIKKLSNIDAIILPFDPQKH